ncbi:MAG: hypothetical protein WCK55_10115 [Verrucomicrobiota bacterium]
MSNASPQDGNLTRGKKRTPWFRRRSVWAALIVAMLAGFAMVAGPRLKRAYDRRSATSAVRRAAEALAKGDIKHAMLEARIAYNLNTQDVEANRIIAQCLEAAGLPAAQEWRRRVDALRPGDAENLIAWAEDSLTAGYPDTASDALGKVKPEDRNTAAYHDLAARLAITRHDEAEAESHWKEAARLDPKVERHRLNLAVLQRKSADGAAREEAMEALRELAAKPDSAHAAQRALLADALARGDGDRAKEAAAALASAPGATFQDRLSHLAVLQKLKDPGFSPLLARLREDALAKPPDLFQLLSWMNKHDLSLLVVEWLRELPRDVLAHPPVCVAVADTRTRAKDWETLLREVEIGKWGASEFVRQAYESLAQERQNEHDASVALWKQAVTATEQRPERLEILAQLAFDWHWEDRATELLWKLTATGSAPRKVLDTLWEAAARTRNTEQMRAISKMRMKADPRSIEARNNFAFLSLLTRSTEGGIHEIADALYKDAPGNPEVVATYAFSLYRREKIAEALSAMQALKPEQLREPPVARYLGIFLSAAGRDADAAESLALGEKGFILPEETELIRKAKAGTPAKRPAR